MGAGGGTVLIVLMLQVIPPAAAIPAHGVVQLASNTSRAWMLRRHMAWPIILRFAALMPFGVALGLWLFQGLPAEAVQMLIGAFVLGGIVALLIGQIVLMRWFMKSPSERALYYSGFGVPIYVSGMMVSAFALRSVS